MSVCFHVPVYVSVSMCLCVSMCVCALTPGALISEVLRVDAHNVDAIYVKALCFYYQVATHLVCAQFNLSLGYTRIFQIKPPSSSRRYCVSIQTTSSQGLLSRGPSCYWPRRKKETIFSSQETTKPRMIPILKLLASTPRTSPQMQNCCATERLWDQRYMCLAYVGVASSVIVVLSCFSWARWTKLLMTAPRPWRWILSTFELFKEELLCKSMYHCSVCV